MDTSAVVLAFLPCRGSGRFRLAPDLTQREILLAHHHSHLFLRLVVGLLVEWGRCLFWTRCGECNGDPVPSNERQSTVVCPDGYVG